MPAATEPAGELYFRTDISPEIVFVAIGQLRREAGDEIDWLIRFLNGTDDHMEREPDDDEPSLGTQDAFPGMGPGGGGDDREPDLGSFDRVINQERSNRQRIGAEQVEVDAELDYADLERTLGSLDHNHSQERWAAGGRRDLEADPAESGIGDHDGLHEQAGTNDWQQGSDGMKAQSWHRRHAIQMVAHLSEDALMVPRLSEQLVTAFLTVDEEERWRLPYALIGGNDCA
ncbi:hypothetical protein [Bradyrhizobium sp. JR3.5]